jgi:hypothetical protein
MYPHYGVTPSVNSHWVGPLAHSVSVSSLCGVRVRGRASPPLSSIGSFAARTLKISHRLSCGTAGQGHPFTNYKAFPSVRKDVQ